MTNWKNVNAIYQIYPRSFQDENGDGVGDLAGITARLPYIKGEQNSLGIDAIWISPIFMSPMADFGYDVSNYTAIDPLFGTLQDFDKLIHEANSRDILVMLDFVPNHSSDQHYWFQQALSSKQNRYRNYYHFRDPAADGGPPNNWLSVFGGSAWELDEASGQYYLHSFLKEQPDLNWENPVVQEEMANVLRFWLKRGVKGFRFDAVRWMAKDIDYRDDPLNPEFDPSGDPYHALIHQYSRYGDRLDFYLKSLTNAVDEYENSIVIFEDYHDSRLPRDEQIDRFYAIDGDSSFPINLEPIHFEWTPRDFATNIARYQRGLAAESEMIMAVGNHDSSRIVARHGVEKAKLIALIQLTLSGVPIVYYGDEIGMDDGHIALEDVRDPFELNVPGLGLGRDPQRTPMQWSDEYNAGFSAAGKTWLPVSDTKRDVNVESQLDDETSFFGLYKRLLSFRSSHCALRAGSYDPLLVGKGIYFYVVSDDQDKFGVVANFSDEVQSILINEDYGVLLSVQRSSTQEGNKLVLPPYEGVIIRYL